MAIAEQSANHCPGRRYARDDKEAASFGHEPPKGNGHLEKRNADEHARQRDLGSRVSSLGHALILSAPGTDMNKPRYDIGQTVEVKGWVALGRNGVPKKESATLAQ